MSKPQRYPTIACGYHVDLHYISKFLELECNEEFAPHLADLELHKWWWQDLSSDERFIGINPRPARITCRDGTYDKIEVFLVTRAETIRKKEDVKERLYEMESDRQQRDKLMKSLATKFRITSEFDVSGWKFDMQPYAVGASVPASVPP